MFDRIPNRVDPFERMKTKVLAVFCVAAVALSTAGAPAASNGGAFVVVVDAVVVRPACVAATAVGSVVFALTLPFTAATKSVKRTGNLLVVKPAQAAFRRPLGDMEALRDE